MLTVERAGLAMLITTLTSAAAFFSNMLSTLPALRAFGLFMGSVLLCNYALVMTIYPAALALHEMYVPVPLLLLLLLRLLLLLLLLTT